MPPPPDEYSLAAFNQERVACDYYSVVETEFFWLTPFLLFTSLFYNMLYYQTLVNVINGLLGSH